MRKKAIMSISFGTKDPEIHARNIDVLETDYRSAHPDCSLYRVITSDAVIEAYKQDGDPVYAVREAMARMVLDGVTHLYAQPAYLLDGQEYRELWNMIYSHKADFIEVRCGTPLLYNHADIEAVVQALMQEDYADLAEDEAVVFIGHGSHHTSNAMYCALDYVFKDLGYKNAHVGTFNAFPKIDTVIHHLQRDGIKTVHVAPFMFVAGPAAMEGVCGSAANSMKSQLEQAGMTVIAHRKCLGEYTGIRKVFQDHLEQIMD